MESMLESGAFSCKDLPPEEQLKIEDYIQFCHDYGHLFKAGITNLDVVGDAELSMQNYNMMREAGLDPIPVFHAGTDSKYLEYYFTQTDFIALGALTERFTSDNVTWLDEVWGKYLHKNKCKVHCLGLTNSKTIMRYPWYSCDSSTYIQTAVYGKVHIPYSDNGSYVYADEYKQDTYAVSNESKGRRDRLDKHYSDLRQPDKERFKRYIEQECHSTINLIEKHFRERLWVNGIFFIRMEPQLKHPTKIFMSVLPSQKDQVDVVRALNKKEVMVSYFYYLKNEKKFLEFVQGGFNE